MKMHKEEYEKLIKRFTLELSEVGITENLVKIIEARYDRTPHVIGVSESETTDSFVYKHNGYTIEAKRTVTLEVKKCK